MEAEQDLSRFSIQRSPKPSSDSTDEEAAAFADGSLIDKEWTARYQEGMKGNEDLERIIKDRLQVNTEVKKSG